MAESVKKGARITGTDRSKLAGATGSPDTGTSDDPPIEPTPTDVSPTDPVLKATEPEE